MAVELRVSHLQPFPVTGEVDGDTGHYRGSVLQAEGGEEEAEGVCVRVCMCVGEGMQCVESK